MDKTIQLSKNKSFEVQLSKWEPTSWFDVHFKWDFNVDHCGPMFSIEVYKVYFCIQIYDHRHWNHDANRFYNPGEEWDKLAELEKQIGNRSYTGSSGYIIKTITKL